VTLPKRDAIALATISVLAAMLLPVWSMPAIAQVVVLPPAGAQYDSQLGGAYAPPPGTRIVSRDREAPPAPGLYNICYVNAFQTQPQDSDWWITNHPDLLLQRLGTWVEDANWPGEILLDTSSAATRAGLLAIVNSWIDGCADAGYDAIEADNLDTYSRSGGALTIADNLAFAAELVAHAHAQGLAFGQKNSGELVDRGQAIGFDFAIVESCEVYEECDGFTQVFGAHVLEIEYTDTDAAFFHASCAKRGDMISIVRRDRNLTAPGDASYVYESC
jgi:hypothetical protein